MHRLYGVTFCTAILLVTFLQANETEPEVAKELHKGVCIVARRYSPSPEAYDQLSDLNVNWISQTPFGWQQSVSDPHLEMRTARVMWGESDGGLAEVTSEARKRGIKTMLKPHIWIRDRSDGKWRGEIGFDTQEEWDQWWGDYKAFILHYAQVAEKNGMEAFCIGTELRSTVKEHPEKWRQLIGDIREVYGGQLTYSANWYKEFEEVTFWDLLDYIGVQAYFPLVGESDGRPDVETLKTAWRAHARKIAALHDRIGKPVIFTEAGYRSTADAAVSPWEWRTDAALDLDLRAICYEAMFQTFWHQPWFHGMYVWKWYPEGEEPSRPQRRRGRFERSRERDFTPQGKPATQVIARWYGSEKGE